jgi:hypothetical protein
MSVPGCSLARSFTSFERVGARARQDGPSCRIEFLVRVSLAFPAGDPAREGSCSRPPREPWHDPHQASAADPGRFRRPRPLQETPSAFGRSGEPRRPGRPLQATSAPSARTGHPRRPRPLWKTGPLLGTPAASGQSGHARRPSPSGRPDATRKPGPLQESPAASDTPASSGDRFYSQETSSSRDPAAISP